MRKRITALAMEGDRLVLFDNIAGNFGGPAIDRALTSTRWKDRILGRSEQMEAPLLAAFYGTGNNVELGGDVMRRLAHIRLETPDENPEERSGFTHPDLRAWATENRNRLLGAGLTILVAYFKAGAPVADIKAWGSYEGWSRVIRQAIVWLGLEDPHRTKEGIQSTASIKESAVRAIIDGWALFHPGPAGLACHTIASTVFPAYPKETPDQFVGIADALRAVSKDPNSRTIGNLFRIYRTKRFGTKYLKAVGKDHNASCWKVVEGESGESGDTFPAHTANTEDKNKEVPKLGKEKTSLISETPHPGGVTKFGDLPGAQ